MLKMLLYLTLAIIILLSIYLSIFEFLLYSFHSPFNSSIKEPLAHSSTWTYLLHQQYISFIEVDIFNIHEKRHLLDVKRVFEQTYSLWMFFTSLASLIFIFFLIKIRKSIKKLLTYTIVLGVTINSLFILFSLNFVEHFKFSHTLFFTQNSWIFSENSLLIEWFPLSYFQEFFLLFLLLNFSILLCVYFIKSLSFPNQV